MSKGESTLTDSTVTQAAPESPGCGVCLGSPCIFCPLLVQVVTLPSAPSRFLEHMVPMLFIYPSVGLAVPLAPEAAQRVPKSLGPWSVAQS